MEWQPIETAPKDGRPVLVAGKHYVEIAKWGYLYLKSGKEELHGWTLPGLIGSSLNDVTHWMPLPHPPLSPNPAPEPSPYQDRVG